MRIAENSSVTPTDSVGRLKRVTLRPRPSLSDPKDSETNAYDILMMILTGTRQEYNRSLWGRNMLVVVYMVYKA